MRELWKLFVLFCKIGLFMFGGGYAMLPILKAELVDKRRFVTEDELLDMYSIGNCTPGVIAVNVATFIGYKRLGVLGAVVTTLGVILAPLIIILLIASVLRQFTDQRYAAYAFAGIRICAAALILNVIYDLARKNIRDYSAAAIFLGALALLAAFNLSAVVIVILAAVTALALGEIRRKR